MTARAWGPCPDRGGVTAAELVGAGVGEWSPGSRWGLSAAAEPAGAQPDLPPSGDLAASPVLAGGCVPGARL